MWKNYFRSSFVSQKYDFRIYFCRKKFDFKLTAQTVRVFILFSELNHLVCLQDFHIFKKDGICKRFQNQFVDDI